MDAQEGTSQQRRGQARLLAAVHADAAGQRGGHDRAQCALVVGLPERPLRTTRAQALPGRVVGPLTDCHERAGERGRVRLEAVENLGDRLGADAWREEQRVDARRFLLGQQPGFVLILRVEDVDPEAEQPQHDVAERRLGVVDDEHGAHDRRVGGRMGGFLRHSASFRGFRSPALQRPHAAPQGRRRA